MSSNRFSSIATANVAAISLARSATFALQSSDADIDRSVSFDDIELLQTNGAIADVDAVLEMELVRVPRADDMHVLAIVILAQDGAIGPEHVEHLRHQHAFAHRPALVRAVIAVGVILAIVANDSNLEGPDRHDPRPALGNLAVLADQYFRHVAWLLARSAFNTGLAMHAN